MKHVCASIFSQYFNSNIVSKFTANDIVCYHTSIFNCVYVTATGIWKYSDREYI